MHLLLSILQRHAATGPSRPALLIGKQASWVQLSYRDLLAETERWARIFVEKPLRRGEVLFIVLDHRHELYPAYLGAMRGGLIPSFLPLPTPKQDPDVYWGTHAELLDRVRPTGILTDEATATRLSAFVRPGDCALLDIDRLGGADPATDLPGLDEVERPAAIALLQHSSGTTGLKKGVALTFAQVQSQLSPYAAAIAAAPSDRTVSWLPLYHDMGLISGFLLPLSVGSMVVAIDTFEWLTKPDMFLDLIARHCATLAWLPNFAFNHLVRTRDPDRRYDLSSMRAFVNASEPCKPDTFDAFRAAFAEHGLAPTALQTCYGMAETVAATAQSDLGAAPRVLNVDAAALAKDRIVVPLAPGQPGGARFLSCGRPIDGLRLRIASDGGPGEIQVSGDCVISEYHRNPAATAAAFDGPWYNTGDIGFIHEGELYVCGRRKEVLIVHGRTYYANDIEEAVNTVEGVKPGRVVAFGFYGPATASEEAVVLVESVTDGDAALGELKKRIRRRIFDKLGLTVNRIELSRLGSLIKTTSGKISREANLKRYQASLDVA